MYVCIWTTIHTYKSWLVMSVFCSSLPWRSHRVHSTQIPHPCPPRAQLGSPPAPSFWQHPWQSLHSCCEWTLHTSDTHGTSQQQMDCHSQTCIIIYTYIYSMYINSQIHIVMHMYVCKTCTYKQLHMYGCVYIHIYAHSNYISCVKCGQACIGGINRISTQLTVGSVVNQPLQAFNMTVSCSWGVYVYRYVHTYVWIFVHNIMHVCRVCTCICTYVRMYIRMYVCKSLSVQS